MIDTHTHIYMPEYDLDGQPGGSYAGQCAAVDAAVDAGVNFMVLPCVDRASIEAMHGLHALRPDRTAITLGLHPTELGDRWRQDIEFMGDMLRQSPENYCAVGEIGMDLYWEKDRTDEQMQAFDAQLSLAEETGKPVIIHNRDALDATLEVLGGHKGVEAVFHCFGGSTADVERIRRTGDYYFGIGGVLTFKNSGLAAVLPAIGADRIVTETDSPWLAPVPYRGKRNQSAYIPFIVNAIAKSLGLDTASVDDITTENAKKLFKI